jgi:hypothetical protein
MNMAPSEQQSMEMAASALAMEALYKDRSSGGKWQGSMNKNMAASVTELVKQYRVTSTGEIKHERTGSKTWSQRSGRRITQVGFERRGNKAAEDDNEDRDNVSSKVRMRKQNKSETEGRGNKAAEDDGDARERERVG